MRARLTICNPDAHHIPQLWMVVRIFGQGRCLADNLLELNVRASGQQVRGIADITAGSLRA